MAHFMKTSALCIAAVFSAQMASAQQVMSKSQVESYLGVADIDHVLNRNIDDPTTAAVEPSVYEVSIFKNDFMPPEIYLVEGDIIAFQNLDSSTRRVKANGTNSRVGWNSGAIYGYQTTYMLINQTGNQDFFSAYSNGSRTKSSTSRLRNGRIYWGVAPDTSLSSSSN
ncbi:hypothetical protein [Halocynthiibacter namhaensis]|uniref:hypothetical protein n=1 Tax=Halocynthiibacter namhaensis TaxID=1290553 RepID=UPI00057921E8|nr:hypothetical protein [Halocynthiibacter namhaensis]